MQLVLPASVQGGGGSIINMGSSYGLRCEPGFLAYAASKEAIRALTRTAAREWGKHKIRVNTILPSALTPKAIWYLKESGTYDLELAKVAMGRFGRPETSRRSLYSSPATKATTSPARRSAPTAAARCSEPPRSRAHTIGKTI